jgi:hypothetical protein
MNVNVRTKIRYKGQEYSDPSQLPPEVRSAFDKAIADGAVTKKVTKIMVNGQEVASQDENVRKLCDDVMSVIENNGEVTLPTERPSDPLITKRQLLLLVALVASLALGAWLFLNG